MRASLALFLVLLSACAAANRTASPAGAALEPARDPAPTPPPLDRSLFGPRGSSSLSEADIARILDAPLELKLPARVGVAALAQPFEPRPPEHLGTGLAATRALGEALEGTRLVSVATDVATSLPAGQGIEGLRELAARYRTPYLVLYSERFEDRSHANGWSVLWITVIGGLLTPSRTLKAEGVLEASLFDVRTGTILFTVQEPAAFESTHLPIGAGAAFEDELREAAGAATGRLAERVVAKLQRLARDAGNPAPPVAGTDSLSGEQAPIRIALEPGALVSEGATLE